MPHSSRFPLVCNYTGCLLFLCGGTVTEKEASAIGNYEFNLGSVPGASLRYHSAQLGEKWDIRGKLRLSMLVCLYSAMEAGRLQRAGVLLVIRPPANSLIRWYYGTTISKIDMVHKASYLRHYSTAKWNILNIFSLQYLTNITYEMVTE